MQNQSVKEGLNVTPLWAVKSLQSSASRSQGGCTTEKFSLDFNQRPCVLPTSQRHQCSALQTLATMQSNRIRI